MGGGIVELLGHAYKLVVANGFGERINGHGSDELVVLDSGAVLQGHGLRLGINIGDGAVLAEARVLLLEGFGDSNPDASSAVTSRETESGIGSPVTRGFLKDDILGNIFQIGCRDTLA